MPGKFDSKISENRWAIFQIELYNAAEVIKNQKIIPENFMKDRDWLLTMPSVSEGKNYLITNSEVIKKVTSEKIKSNWDGLCAQTDKLYLRKEILKILNLK